jgi:NAD(P)-dependent dehydrogenase (short-subunit alcohol dehydrogenase family)
VVIANAGIASENHGGDLPLSSTPADMLNVYNTNVVGSLLTIQAYNSLLCAGTPRLLMVISSRLGSIEQTAGTGMMTSYRASKAAVNMLAMTYAEDKAFRAAGGKVLAVHPGEQTVPCKHHVPYETPCTHSYHGTHRLGADGHGAVGRQEGPGDCGGQRGRHAAAHAGGVGRANTGTGLVNVSGTSALYAFPG